MSKRFPGRKLSVLRLGMLTAALAAVAAIGLTSWGNFQDGRTAAAIPSIFSGYVDVTATPRLAFEDPVNKQARDVVLAFIVADPGNPCEPTWGTAYSLAEAESGLDLDRRIARLHQLGGTVSVSFGGLTNNELATVCTDPEQLKAAYREVVNRYSVATIDLDVEGGALSDLDSLDRRGTAVAGLQKEMAAAGKELNVWLTLPADPNGLTAAGSEAVRRTINTGTELAGVNIMTMDFGGSRLPGQSMYQSAAAAAAATHSQLTGIYRTAGVELGSGTVWRKIGLTPMIGQNDIAGEIFTLDDANELNDFATQKGVGRLSMWSLNRDRTCSQNYPDVRQVSDACSGVDQGDSLYSQILGDTISGKTIPAAAAKVSTAPASPPVSDDPSTSPYPVWVDSSAFTAGDRIVWHANVYEAKWWTRGDTPDNPVLQGTSTPWRLIGPVLPGDKPVPQITVPAGTAPAWSPSTVYTKGQRVLFESRLFEAKWWTQTDSPEAALQGAADSPWSKLTDKEVRKILATAPPK